MTEPNGARPERPIRLLPIFKERVWGRDSLDPFFGKQSRRIGEVWFTCDENLTADGERLDSLIGRYPDLLGQAAEPRQPQKCPLLIKFLFTDEALSVQVHPDNEYAADHHQSPGKTEAWYVIDSQNPGQVAVGFREEISPDRLQSISESGEIERLLAWRKAQAGHLVFVPAGTVHAIGAGLTICEIQQNSDVTYRLYDYGRPRELHLDHGARVSRLGPSDCEPKAISLEAWRKQLIECEYFRIEKLNLPNRVKIPSKMPQYVLLICLAGSGRIGEDSFEAGQVWFVPAANDSILIEGGGSEWLLTYSAQAPVLLQECTT